MYHLCIKGGYCWDEMCSHLVVGQVLSRIYDFFFVKGGGMKLQNHDILMPYVLLVLLLFLLTFIIEMLYFVSVVASLCE